MVTRALAIPMPIVAVSKIAGKAWIWFVLQRRKGVKIPHLGGCPPIYGKSAADGRDGLAQLSIGDAWGGLWDSGTCKRFLGMVNIVFRIIFAVKCVNLEICRKIPFLAFANLVDFIA